ncbi:MAG: triple tyrosine motif-containing protein, partial [Phocaeicola sp.]
LLCTEWNGLFLFDGTKVKQWHTNIDQKLKKNQLNRATTTKKDSTIILGSIRDGIYAIDKNGELKWSYNTTNKLYNNSVLRLFCDEEDNIWAALDNGVALIHTASGISILEPHVSDFSLGMVYGIGIWDEKLYVATNNGAYIVDYLADKITTILNTEGQNWHISQFNSQLLIGNNRGTKNIIGKTAYSISNNGGGSTCIRKCKVNDQDILIESSYSSLRIYKFMDGKWELTNLIKNFSAPIRQFEVDHTGTIWASHMNKGLYRLTLSNDLTKISTEKYYPNIANDLKSPTLFVTKIRGRIVISASNNLYTYDDLSQTIIPFTQLNDVLKNGIISATMVDDNTFWVANKEGYALINYENNRYNLLQSIRATYFGTECNETNNNVFVKDSGAYFCLNNAIAYYDGSDSKKSKRLKRELIITSATSTSQTKEERLPLITSISEPANSSSYIEFSVSYPNYSSDNISYNYKLEGGGDKIETRSTENSIFFSNLNFGNYSFECTALNDKGEELSTKSYHFRVVKPFYLSFFAMILYIATFITTAYWWARWKSNKAMKLKQQEYEADKINQNLQLLEQEKIINEQQKQLLSTELALRSKENASLALDLLARDKAIESFKEFITEHQRSSSMSQKEADLLLSKFNQKFGSHEFLDIYQKNFDLIHENFFRNLRTSYPTLTSSDLKFCALLRLNLSTKDISQFTNLTIRGVEAARYRIRKKMEIPEGVSLVDFLIDFKG